MWHDSLSVFILNIKLFLSSAVYLFSSHGGNFLVNAFLVKKNWNVKLLAWILSFTFVLYSASLYANIRIFNLSQESLKLHNYLFTDCAHICILFLSEQLECWKKISHPLFFHFLICTQSKFILNNKKTCLLHIPPQPTGMLYCPKGLHSQIKIQDKIIQNFMVATAG